MKKAKKDELEQRLARALADYDNLVKRTEREKEEIILRATKRLVEDLLPAIDNLERAQEHLKDEGLQMALAHIRRILEVHGVREIKALKGDKFDGRRHEAIETVGGGKEGVIAKVFEKGYEWNDGIVIRPAKVQVYGKRHAKEEELEKELTRGDYV